MAGAMAWNMQKNRRCLFWGPKLARLCTFLLECTERTSYRYFIGIRNRDNWDVQCEINLSPACIPDGGGGRTFLHSPTQQLPGKNKFHWTKLYLETSQPTSLLKLFPAASHRRKHADESYYVQRRRLHNLSWQTFQCSVTQESSYVCVEFLCSSLCPLPLVVLLHATEKSLAPSML